MNMLIFFYQCYVTNLNMTTFNITFDDTNKQFNNDWIILNVSIFEIICFIIYIRFIIYILNN